MKILFNDKDISLLKRAFIYIKPYKVKIALTFFLMSLNVILSLAQPFIWAKLLVSIFDRNFNSVIYFVILTALLYIFELARSYAENQLFFFLRENMIMDLKCDIYRNIINLPVQAFDKMRVGDFMSRLNNDSQSIAEILTGQVLSGLIDILKVIIMGIVAMSINVYLSLIILGIFPIMYLITEKSGKKIRKAKEELLKSNDGYTSQIQQSFSEIKEIKSLGILNVDFKRYYNNATDLKNKNLFVNFICNISQMLLSCIYFISNVIITLVGSFFVFSNTLKIEFFITFTAYSQFFSGSLMNISKLNSKIQESLASLERIFHLIDNLNYPVKKGPEKEVKDIDGFIRFNNVCFQYEDNIKVLEDINFTVKPNTRTALVGLSGSGKSTIFNLIMRFYQPVSGHITIDNHHMSELSDSSLYSQISIVRQEPVIFNCSIKENFILANPASTDTDIMNACMKANIHDYISNLPDKYDTIIGEGGVNLSCGQKQRIAIARTLIRGSKIILFDEATSSLDNESEQKIKQTINDITIDHTVIIIAHRLSTIIEADNIIVIDENRITGQGTHNNLIESNDVYRRIYNEEFSAYNSMKKVIS
jgi:ATP-binding cassette subfamily B protein